MGCVAQLAWKWVLTLTFRRAILTHKVGQTGLVLVCDEGSLVGLCTHNHKSLRAAITICTALAYPKFDFYILTHVTLKSKSNQRWICQFMHTCQMHLTCIQSSTHISIFYDDLKPSKVVQGDLFFIVWSGFISRSVHKRSHVSVCNGYNLSRSG